MIGQTISHYRILEKLGEGGMGVVYKAEDTNLDRTVAMKFLAPHLLDSEEHKQRFLREAKAAASLDHPNICTVHEVGEADGRVFLAMGYIDGMEVRAKIKERPLKLDEALDIAIQAAEGLRAAHQLGVVHRDIKSSNLMVTSPGQVKIMDFGLAQLTDGTRITKADTTLGTPAYMSPEQAQGLATDKRADIWSLAVVLYEMVTGRLPFSGEREAAVVHSIIHDGHEPITALRAGVPLELDRIVGKALAKKPEQRYQHIDDMVVDLRRLKENVSGGREPIDQKRMAPRWLWAGSLPLLLVIAYFWYRNVRTSENTEPLRAVPLTSLPGVERYPSLSPDGNYVTFSWTQPGKNNADVYVQTIGSGDPLQRTTDPANDYNPVWSPDGQWIAFLRSQSEAGVSELWLIPTLRGKERKLGNLRVRGGIWVTPPYLAWSPDSTSLVVTDSQGDGKPDALFVIPIETREKRRLTDPQPPALGDTNPAVSPDGAWLVFRRSLSLYSGELYRLALGRGLTSTEAPERITSSTLNAKDPAWMPDSQEILFAVRGGLRRLTFSGEGSRRLPFVGEDGEMPAVSLRRSGRPTRLVYVRSSYDDNIWIVHTSAQGAPTSSPPFALISSTRGDWFPQFSPDNRRIAFTSDRSGEGAVWVADADGSSAAALAVMSAFATGGCRWSPDGGRIVFHSNREGQAEIYSISSAGGKPLNLTSHPANDSFPSFSKDGQWIYFSSNRSGDRRIWKMPSSGGNAVLVSDRPGYTPLESPDGNYLYFIETMDKPSPLWRLPTSGGLPTKVLDGVYFGSYVVLEEGIYYIERPSGQGGVHYLDKPSGESRLQYFNLATQRSITVAANLGNAHGYVSASKDGRSILFGRTDSSIDDLMLVEDFR